ncbi:ATP-dependent helicase [Halalkalibacter oceani]|uniref:ATP-dependent helicase n=1 Tax=Halalkalibacter oceani TaxID=1653776 RepID=UPI003396FDC9
MQVAYYQDKLIALHTCERSEWQQLYMASKRDEITCPHCHTPVRIELGITAPPLFSHTGQTEECENVAQLLARKQDEQQRAAEQESTTIQLPKRRSISDSGSSSLSRWKEPEPLKAVPPFSVRSNDKDTMASGYRHTLLEQGILLDDQQWTAVTTTEGPLLVLAGAGSGKTRVLTARAAYMLVELGHSPKEMILVTFTAKAAKEMKERMKQYPGLTAKHLQPLVVGTFHSIFYKMLLHADAERWNQTNLLKADWQKQAMVKEAGREINLEEKEFAFDQALTQISWWKNHLLSPEQVTPRDQWEERTAYLYRRYEQMRSQRKWFDFDDMLLGTYELLHEQPGLLARYQERFSYLSIDEFQDINKVQMEIISLLTTATQHICAVGDDDQSIYSFRGSDPSYILTFQERFPHAKRVVLDENYRSHHHIIAAANNVIAANRKRFSKRLRAQSVDEHLPYLFFPYDEEEEATMIVTDIRKRIERGEKPGDFAVFFRTHHSARALIERFIESSLPIQLEVDGESFYRRKTIRKLLAYLQLALDPEHGEALRELVGALFLKQETVQEIKAISITADCTLIEALTKLKGLPPFQLKKLASLPDKFSMLAAKQPLEAITYIESEMGLDDYLKKQGNEGNKMERGSDDVRDLKVVAKQFQSLASFLAHVEHMTAKYEALRQHPPASPAIQLMTVHRAKGLEFPHVYLIGAVEGGLPHDYALDALREGSDQPLEEERRLMYVAMTRAKQSLAISVPMMRRGKQAFRSRFVRDMQRLATTQPLAVSERRS